MTEPRHDLDGSFISGYLDGELSQGEAQRVRIHLEGCPDCRRIADELTTLRETTMETRFRMPPDTSWDEAPRGGASRWLRDAGIVVGLAWLVGTVVFVVAELAGEADIAGLLLVGGLLLAGGLILASVLIDRRHDLSTDKYRRVKK